MKRLLSALLCASLLLLPGCRSSSDTIPETLADAAAWTAPDGTAVALWESPIEDIYRLEDGTELLRFNTFGPENTHSGKLTGFDVLEPAVREKVGAYYEERGLLFDLEEQIALAYADRLDAQATDRKFYSHYVEQVSVPCYEAERHVGFSTRTVLPENPGAYDRTVVHSNSVLLFDRSTGEIVDPWDLFSVPQDEALDYIFGLDIPHEPFRDPPSREMLKAAFRPKMLTLEPDNIYIDYPAGTLDGVTLGYGISVDYVDLTDILHPWAIPVQEDASK